LAAIVVAEETVLENDQLRTGTINQQYPELITIAVHNVE